MFGFVDYIVKNFSEILILTGEHLTIVFISLFIAILIGIPAGILITNNEKAAKKVISLANIFMTMPSIALFGLMMPILSPLGYGLGMVPAVSALVLYNQLPIIRNTYVALKNIPRPILHAGRGIGLSNTSLLLQLKIPLALPYIISGIRNAAVMNIGIASIACYIGAGGLGVLIQQGINRLNYDMVIAGGVLVSLLAILMDLVLNYVEKKMTPEGIRTQKQKRGA